MTSPMAHYGSSRLPGYDVEYIGTRKVLDNFLGGVMQVLSPRSFRRCFRTVSAVRATPFYLVSHLAGLGSNSQENEAKSLECATLTPYDWFHFILSVGRIEVLGNQAGT